MFKGIRRKIALTNAGIFFGLLLILIIVFGVLISRGLNLSGEFYLHSIADEIISDEKADEKAAAEAKKKTTQEKKESTVTRQYGHEFIIWDASDSAVRMRVENKDLIVNGYELSLRTKESDAFETFQIGGDRYRVYSTPYEKNKATYVLQVFQNINAEQANVNYILFCLFLVGICGLIVLVPISFFSAGRTIQPIKENFEGQRQFIADVSHELRTPLTVIQTNVEVLKMKEDEVIADNFKWLNNISNEAETMSALVSDMILSAQTDNQKITIKQENFDLSLLCVEIVDLMFDLAAEKNIVLSSDITEGIEYKGDEEKLKRAIRILVDNAIKYTPSGGSVMLSLSENVRNVVIAVSDTGIGLSKADQKKVFKRFYRSDEARNRSTGGVGLGLNIADGIVARHNGKIKIDSKINEGSTFTILLPKNKNES